MCADLKETGFSCILSMKTLNMEYFLKALKVLYMKFAEIDTVHEKVLEFSLNDSLKSLILFIRIFKKMILKKSTKSLIFPQKVYKP